MSVKIDQSITVGDRVKSYDFPDNLVYDPERAELCFVEGEVTRITRKMIDPQGFLHDVGYDMYQIDVDKRVWDGVEEYTVETVYVPVNGTEQMFSKHPTHGVHKV